MMGTHRFSRVVHNFINGHWTTSKATKFHDVNCPVTQKTLARTPMSTESEFNEAVSSAKEAYKTWSQVPLPVR